MKFIERFRHRRAKTALKAEMAEIHNIINRLNDHWGANLHYVGYHSFDGRHHVAAGQWYDTIGTVAELRERLENGFVGGWVAALYTHAPEALK